MEDLQRLVRVQRRDDLRQRAEVAVDELAEPARVVERARAGAAGDEELEARACRTCSGRRRRRARPESGRRPPARSRARSRQRSRVLEAGRVVDAPDLADAVGVPVRRQRERLGHARSLGRWFRRSSRGRSRSPRRTGSSGRADPRSGACCTCSPRRAAASASPRSARAPASAPPGSSPRSPRGAVLHDGARRGRAAAVAGALRGDDRTCACSPATGASCCRRRRRSTSSSSTPPSSCGRARTASSSLGLLAPGGIAVLDDLTPGSPGRPRARVLARPTGARRGRGLDDAGPQRSWRSAGSVPGRPRGDR